VPDILLAKAVYRDWLLDYLTHLAVLIS